MLNCPGCGLEVSEGDNFCRRCGYDLVKGEIAPGTPESAIKAVIVKRIDGIKRKDAREISKLIDVDRYTKFDDWPPFERQGSEALRHEAEALEVLKEYSYETRDWKIDLFGDVGLASFLISYKGKIRSLEFYVKSRATVVLIKKGEDWRIVHEHWSRIPRPGEEEERTRRRRFSF
ncbi:MAG: nuclear transport factor 2 family protein [Candidatus Bathyarchaeia archaeon]